MYNRLNIYIDELKTTNLRTKGIEVFCSTCYHEITLLEKQKKPQ